MSVHMIIAGVMAVPLSILFAGFLYGLYLQYVKGEDVINE